jgi:hypothetical protein
MPHSLTQHLDLTRRVVAAQDDIDLVADLDPAPPPRPAVSVPVKRI